MLLLCYNRLLAAHIRAQLDEEQYQGSVTVSTVHAHFRRVIEESSLAEEFRERSAASNDAELFGELYPEFAAVAAMESAARPFDSLVVDEAQDVLTELNIEALSEMVRGGVADGRWRFFLDANNQACVYGHMTGEVLKQVRELASRNLLLTLNCRNTVPISLQTNVLADPDQRAAGRVDGVPVEFTAYETRAQCLSKLGQVIKALRGAGMAPGRISILFPRSPNEEDEQRLAKMGARRLSREDVAGLGTDRLQDHTWAPVSGFKGLENDVIVLVGVDDLESDWSRAITYVGMSRARTQLYVIYHVDCEPVRERRLQEELQRRMEIDGGAPK